VIETPRRPERGVFRGTECLNPPPSSGESANHRFRDAGTSEDGRTRSDGSSGRRSTTRSASSSTASRPIAGAFSSGRTLTRSTKWCASRRNTLTTSRSSTNSPARRGGPSASLSRIPNSARRETRTIEARAAMAAYEGPMVRICLPPAASQTNSHPNRRGPRRISRLPALWISRRPRGPSSTTGQDGRHQARPR
jgi:hypothetical protein